MFFADDISFTVFDEPIFDELLYELLLGNTSFTDKPVDVEILAAFSHSWHTDVAAEGWLFTRNEKWINVNQLMMEMRTGNSNIWRGIVFKCIATFIIICSLFVLLHHEIVNPRKHFGHVGISLEFIIKLATSNTDTGLLVPAAIRSAKDLITQFIPKFLEILIDLWICVDIDLISHELVGAFCAAAEQQVIRQSAKCLDTVLREEDMHAVEEVDLVVSPMPQERRHHVEHELRPREGDQDCRHALQRTVLDELYSRPHYDLK